MADMRRSSYLPSGQEKQEANILHAIDRMFAIRRVRYDHNDYRLANLQYFKACQCQRLGRFLRHDLVA